MEEAGDIFGVKDFVRNSVNDALAYLAYDTESGVSIGTSVERSVSTPCDVPKGIAFEPDDAVSKAPLEPRLLQMIQQEVRKCLEHEVPLRVAASVASAGVRTSEEQVLELLRLRDAELRTLQASVSERTRSVESGHEVMEKLRDQVASLESKVQQLSNELIEARVREQKAVMSADVFRTRVSDMSTRVEDERRMRVEERDCLLRDNDRAKKEQQIEIAAYRRALAAEESRIVALQKEVRCLEMVPRKEEKKTALKRGKKWKHRGKTMEEMEGIYAPLSVKGSTSLPRLENPVRFELTNSPFNRA